MKRLSLQLIWTFCRPIYRIPQDRMADAGHVDADLMCAPGLEFALYICVISKAFQDVYNV